MTNQYQAARNLLSEVVVQAFADLHAMSYSRQQDLDRDDAIRFLKSDEVFIFTDLLGIPRDRVRSSVNNELRLDAERRAQ